MSMVCQSEVVMQFCISMYSETSTVVTIILARRIRIAEIEILPMLPYPVWHMLPVYWLYWRSRARCRYVIVTSS